MKKKLLIAIIIILLVPVVIYFAFPHLLYDLTVAIERKSADFTKKTIDVGAHKVFYLEGGKGESILLLHGFTADKDNWTRFSKFLTPAYHVVAVDLPGFGESSKIQKENYSIASQVKRLNEIINSLRLGKFHLAGNSMGGAIAGKYAVSYPEKVLSLGLLNTGGIYSGEKSEYAKLLEKGENPLLIDSPDDFDTMLKFVFVEPPPIPGPIIGYLTEQSIIYRPFNEKIFKELMEEKFSLESNLSKIRAKTLILWGDADRLIHVSTTKILEKGLPNSTTVIIKNCGHLPMIERPEETAGHYLDFLKKV